MDDPLLSHMVGDPLTRRQQASRKSTVAQLEECLSNCFVHATGSNANRFQSPEVKEAIGRISLAIQIEKGGMGSIADVEEAYSKAATALSNILNNDTADEELIYWIRLFLMHVNKHLHEVVVLADSNKKNPPAHYDKLEEDNRGLRDELNYFKNMIRDLRVELDTYKQMLHTHKQTTGAGGGGGGGGGGSNPGALFSMLTGSPALTTPAQTELVKEVKILDQTLLDNALNATQASTELLQRLTSAQKVLGEIKSLDESIKVMLNENMPRQKKDIGQLQTLSELQEKTLQSTKLQFEQSASISTTATRTPTGP